MTLTEVLAAAPLVWRHSYEDDLRLADALRINLSVAQGSAQNVRIYRAVLATRSALSDDFSWITSMVDWHADRFEAAMRRVADLEAEMNRRGMPFVREVIEI